MKTAGIKSLVEEVLGSLPRAHTEHVIDDVFFAIEHNVGWRAAYDTECSVLGPHVTNEWCGAWIGRVLGKRGEKQVPARKSTLMGSCSILDTDRKPSGSKLKEPEALELMSAYFHANKSDLPPEIRNYRDLIFRDRASDAHVALRLRA
jgi:hypothetical protein